MSESLQNKIGQFLSIADIEASYQHEPDYTAGFSNRGFLRPAAAKRINPRGIFANEKLNGNIDSLLFVGDDTERYRPQLERLQQTNQPVWYFRQYHNQPGLWRVMGKVYIDALLDPDADYTQARIHEEEGILQKTSEGWMLTDLNEIPQFHQPRQLSYVLALRGSVDKQNQPSGLIEPDEFETGRCVEREVKVRLDQQKLRRKLLKRYSGCVITGLLHNNNAPWIEAAHIDTHKTADGHFTRNDSKNGFLLRADLHRLFDADQIAIEPKNGNLILLVNDNSLKKAYAEFLNKPCQLWHEVEAWVDKKILTARFKKQNSLRDQLID